MKKTFLLIPMCIATLLTGCMNNLSENLVSNEKEYDKSFIKLVELNEVNLSESVNKDLFGLTCDSKINFITKKINSNYNRSISTDNLTFYYNDIIPIFEWAVSVIDIPNFNNFSSEEFTKLQRNFPKITLEEVYDNSDFIWKFYQEEISALIIENWSIDSTYPQHRNRSIYDNGKINIFNHEITPLELGILLKHPVNALSLKKSTELTMSLTTNYMGEGDGGDNKKDAFRHSCWNIVLANEASGFKNVRIQWAEDITSAHEAGVNYTGAPSEMDLHNNAVGRSFYLNYTGKTSKIKTYDGILSELKNKANSARFISMSLPLESLKSAINSVDSNTLVYIK